MLKSGDELDERSQSSWYSFADFGARKGAMIRLTNIHLRIQGMSMTLGSIKNCLKYGRTAPLVGALGVPSCMSKAPVHLDMEVTSLAL